MIKKHQLNALAAQTCHDFLTYDHCNFINVDLTTNNFNNKKPGVFNPAKKYPFGLGSERSASVNINI